MSYTLSQLINAIPRVLFGNEHSKVFQQAPFVTLVSKTPKTLEPAMDFEHGGVLTWCKHQQFAIKDTAKLPLDDMDLSTHNFKLLFSPEEIKELDAASNFTPLLVVRVLGIQDGIVEVITLRNRLGGDSLRHEYINLN